MSTTPADLDQQLAAIREQLTEVRRAAIELLPAPADRATRCGHAG
ncbi:hypothetical protein [Gordonia rubripertincta]|uniref:Uncharacterized protein n=1 Tax=Gordonia rubripertincta TaxID=36822 RepID=A0ABT4N351_GORRU|nr:hypothetical protein [Gordonia rubripertincta]MCZ4553699.1 hypothetical protein [Gordonia rubripertincta]